MFKLEINGLDEFNEFCALVRTHFDDADRLRRLTAELARATDSLLIVVQQTQSAIMKEA